MDSVLRKVANLIKSKHEKTLKGALTEQEDNIDIKPQSH